MGLFSSRKKKARSFVLIDIGSASVGGAYAHLAQGKAPVLYYTARVDIEPRENEDITDAMLRSLAYLEHLMTVEGAPQLHRATGSALLDQVLVTVASPWQETEVNTIHLEQPQPFIFTKARLHAASKDLSASSDRVLTSRSLMSASIDGYEVSDPFGKRAHRVDLTLLSSTLDTEATHQIRASLRKVFHTHEMEVAAFAPLAYRVFMHLYPHQDDFLLIDVSGSGTDVVLVKRRRLMGVHTLPQGTHDLLKSARVGDDRSEPGTPDILVRTTGPSVTPMAETAQNAWIGGLEGAFASFTAGEALPHTVFLLADERSRAYLKRTLEESTLSSLWLAGGAFSVITVEPSQFAPKVAARGLAEGDPFLAMLALSTLTEDEWGMEIPAPEPLTEAA